MLRLFSILFAFALTLAPLGARANPVHGADGVLRYPVVTRTPALLACVPLYVCDVILQPGEQILNVAVGDSLRWLIAPAASGATRTPHLLIKPTAAGLRTDLLVTTDRRTYALLLVSRSRDPMLRVGFFYPKSAQVDTALPTAALDKLDFAYYFSGEKSLQPVRAFNDGTHTYLQMSPALRELPVLFAVGRDGSDTIVNYRVIGTTYIVDGVPDALMLIDGTGKAQRRALVSRGNGS